MTPFRPTLDRIWEAMRQLRFDGCSERRYEVVLHPATKDDLLQDPRILRFGAPAVEHDGPVLKVFGIPTRDDPLVKPGWIHLRHEVIQ